MLEAIAVAISISAVLAIILMFILGREAVLQLLHLDYPWRDHLAAENRARMLLRDILTPQEYHQLTRFGYLEVASPSHEQRIYRIPGAGGLVKVFDRGCAVMELCLQPAEPLPDGDVVVMHKLMIQSNEQEYLNRSNRFAPGIISLRYSGA